MNFRIDFACTFLFNRFTNVAYFQRAHSYPLSIVEGPFKDPQFTS